MARQCQYTKKKPSKGKSYSIRGIAKKKKGIGLNVTGTEKRRFTPNTQKKRFWFAEEKRFVTLKLSTNAMRTIDKKGIGAVIAEMRSRGEKI